jgi:hypothetical protein
MRPTIAITTLAAAALAGCGQRSAAVDSTQVAQYAKPGTSAPASAAASGRGPKCLTAADVKSAMGFDVRDLTGGMRQYGTMWNCGFAATDASLPGVTVSATVTLAAEADSVFDHITNAVKISKGGNAQPDVLQIGERGLAYGSLSNSVAAAVSNGQLYVVEAMYGAAGRGFGDRKDASIELLRKFVP